MIRLICGRLSMAWRALVHGCTASAPEQGALSLYSAGGLVCRMDATPYGMAAIATRHPLAARLLDSAAEVIRSYSRAIRMSSVGPSEYQTALADLARRWEVYRATLDLAAGVSGGSGSSSSAPRSSRSD